MAQDLTIPQNFGAPSTVFSANDLAEADELGAGVTGGFSVLGCRGKVWRLKHRGEETPLVNEQGDPVSSVELVIIKSAPTICKTYYANGYSPDSNVAPDCWSTNGQAPDVDVEAPVSATCSACAFNQFGSRITESGNKGKACSDAKRLAVVPLLDIPNEVYSGPMLLRVPAASLGDMKTYADKMKSLGHPYFAIGTRIKFDMNEAYPKFLFGAIRPLTDDEALLVKELRDDPRVSRILNESIELALAPRQSHEERVDSAFEQPPAPAPAPVARPVAAQVATGAPRPTTAARPAPTPTQGVRPAPSALAGGAAPKPAPVQTRPAPRPGGIAAAVARPVQPAAKPVAQQPLEEEAPPTAPDSPPAGVELPPSFAAGLDEALEKLL